MVNTKHLRSIVHYSSSKFSCKFLKRSVFVFFYLFFCVCVCKWHIFAFNWPKLKGKNKNQKCVKNYQVRSLVSWLLFFLFYSNVKRTFPIYCVIYQQHNKSFTHLHTFQIPNSVVSCHTKPTRSAWKLIRNWVLAIEFRNDRKTRINWSVLFSFMIFFFCSFVIAPLWAETIILIDHLHNGNERERERERRRRKRLNCKCMWCAAVSWLCDDVIAIWTFIYLHEFSVWQ